MSSNHPSQPKAHAPIDTAAIRIAAQNLDEGAVTSGYRGNRQEIIDMLNGALATELVCIMRYKRHYFTVTGRENLAVKAEFLQHAQEEGGPRRPDRGTHRAAKRLSRL